MVTLSGRKQGEVEEKTPPSGRKNAGSGRNNTPSGIEWKENKQGLEGSGRETSSLPDVLMIAIRPGRDRQQDVRPLRPSKSIGRSARARYRRSAA